jgi:hypothetical protein
MTNSPMLLPRFTIRTLLVILTVCAFVFVMVGTAFRGQYWAWGVTIAIVSMIVTALTHVAWFGLVSFFPRFIETGIGAAVPVSAGPQTHSAARQPAHDDTALATVDGGAER